MILTLLYVFSFLSFNTKAMMPNDRRLEPLVEMVKNADADFVFLTEEYTGQVRKMLGDQYEYYEWATAHIDETERFFSKYPIVGVESIGPVSDGKYTDNWVHRVQVVPEPGDTISIYCCHWPHGMNDRIFIANEMLKDMAAEGKKAIAGGDFNSLSITSPILMLARNGMYDCWLEKGRGSSATFHELPIGVRIDYIFHSKGIRTLNVRRISGSGISDHDAMFAEFEID